MKNKIIKVSNDKELLSFFRKLWLYKLQKNTLFILEEDIFELNKIIAALNIKNRKKRIEFVYDESCFEVDNCFKNKNICGFINNQCYTQRGTNKYNGCCRICRYQSSKGCTTSNFVVNYFFAQR